VIGEEVVDGRVLWNGLGAYGDPLCPGKVVLGHSGACDFIDPANEIGGHSVEGL
jgi:hypothetical protein